MSTLTMNERADVATQGDLLFYEWKMPAEAIAQEALCTVGVCANNAIPK